MNRVLRVLVVAAPLAACSGSGGGGTAAPADSIFHNGRIYTVDAGNTWAEALATIATSKSWMH